MDGQQTAVVQGQRHTINHKLLVPPSQAWLITHAQKAILPTCVCTFVFISHWLFRAWLNLLVPMVIKQAKDIKCVHFNVSNSMTFETSLQMNAIVNVNKQV